MNNFKSKILIFAIIFVPITISLGLWQIERANEKKVIISNYDKLLVSTPIALQKEQPLENWQPIETFDSGIKKTISWYLNNREWWEKILDNKYQLERKGKKK